MNEKIDKILHYKTWSDKRKIDELLFMSADLWANEGKDSTKAQIELVRKKCRVIYRAIKTLDSYVGSQLLRTQDGKEETK